MEIIKAHEFVCGRTQSGKTHYALEKARAWDGPVILFNPQDVKSGFGIINGNYDRNTLLDYLKKGKKLDYRPQIQKDVAKAELRWLVDCVLNEHVKGRLKNTLFIVDECQIFARSNNDNPAEDIATRGQGKGLYGMFITQRPALVSNTLFTQPEIKTYFDCEDEELPYFKRQGVDTDAVFNTIRTAGKYYYMQKYANELKGPLKV